MTLSSPSSLPKLPNACLGPEWLTLQVICFLPVLANLAIKIRKHIPSLFAGEKTSFYCFAEGLFPLTVRWLTNNTILKERKIQRGDKQVNLTLDFRELDLHHTGNYTCEATERNGITKKRSILFSVLCKHLLLTRLFSHQSDRLV